jgi:hypothetical protein
VQAEQKQIELVIRAEQNLPDIKRMVKNCMSFDFLYYNACINRNILVKLKNENSKLFFFK